MPAAQAAGDRSSLLRTVLRRLFLSTHSMFFKLYYLYRM